ncbi:MAG: ribonuclease P protein component [Bacteroidota bacterium]
MRFPREERLKSRTSIGLLFSRSSRSTGDSGLRLIWTASSEPLERGVQVLVAAPKKHFKRAVVRNRIKRLLREAWRLERGTLPQEWLQAQQPKLLGLIYSGPGEPSLGTLRATLRGLLDRAKW